MQSRQCFLEVRSTPCRHRIGIHQTRTNPPITTKNINFFFCGSVIVVFACKSVHFKDDFFRATQLDHRLSEQRQADHQSKMTSVRGKQNDLHAQWLEGTQVALVSPADQPVQRRGRAAELWRSVQKRTRGSVDEQTACRNKGSREGTPEKHGVPWWADHGVMTKRRARGSNVAREANTAGLDDAADKKPGGQAGEDT